MLVGMQLARRGGFRETVDQLVELEEIGLDAVSVAELYSFDAISQLGYLAARTSRLHIESGIVRSHPDAVADRDDGGGAGLRLRRALRPGHGGVGPPGHRGVPRDAVRPPLGRTREIVELPAGVAPREGRAPRKHYTIPLPADEGTGLGKPLKLINHPVRDRIPVMLAALGPKNVALTAEIAEIREPIWFHPGRASDVWGDALAEGKAKRDPSLGDLQVSVSVPFAVGPGAGTLLEHVRPQLALYIGGMGAKGQNFYTKLVERYGFDEAAHDIQDLYLAGRKDEAAEKVPEELVHAVSLIGTEDEVAAQAREFAAAGVTQLNIQPLDPDHDASRRRWRR